MIRTMSNPSDFPAFTWLEPVHSRLRLFDAERGRAFEGVERGMPVEFRSLVEGVVGVVEDEAGLSLLILRDGLTATTLMSKGADLLMITHIGGFGDDALREAASSLADDAFAATDVTFTVGPGGVALWEQGADFDMASDAMMLIAADLAQRDYVVSIAADQHAGDDRFDAIRLQRA